MDHIPKGQTKKGIIRDSRNLSARISILQKFVNKQTYILCRKFRRHEDISLACTSINHHTTDTRTSPMDSTVPVKQQKKLLSRKIS